MLKNLLIVDRHFMLTYNFFFSSRRRHTRWNCDWSSDVCSSDLLRVPMAVEAPPHLQRRLLEHQRHLVDGAVTRGAADALGDVDLVAEVDVLRQHVHPPPRDRPRRDRKSVV